MADLGMQQKPQPRFRFRWPRSWLAGGFLFSTLLAFFLATHNANLPEGTNLVVAFVYWFFRLSVEFLMFAGVTVLLETTALRQSGGWPFCALIAGVITLVPFVFIVTMYDLAYGLPELQDVFSEGAVRSVLTSLIAETGFLSDNHAVYCLLVMLPRVWRDRRAATRRQDRPVPSELDRRTEEMPETEPPVAALAFVGHLPKDILGEVRLVEAQEHYIRVRTSAGSGLALYRFGDALRDLDTLRGLQVHRSYWVADAAVTALRKTRNGMRLVLDDGEEIPVSRRYEVTVKTRFEDLPVSA